MKITYIHHSCFALETENAALIFDYYTESKALEKIIGVKNQIYVFSSHNHGDHFNPEIFNWAKINKNIKYILSDDIAKMSIQPSEDTLFLSEGEIFEDGNISVKAYGSTDCGISFLVDVCGKSVFHAGDLNNWHWNEQVPPDEANIYSNAFLQKLKALKLERSSINIVMFPVDPRLGRDYFMGAEQFLNEIETELFIPMHFWGNFKKANSFEPVAARYGAQFFTISKTGDFILL